MLIAGIDEAGRGPVIGPMVMAILACKPEDEESLKARGVKDSKLILPAKREELFKALQAQFEHEIIELSPEEIDSAVGSKNGDNLNKLEARTTALLIQRLSTRVPLQKVIIDSPAKDGAKYEAEVMASLKELMDKPPELQCEIKADLNYPVVGAASILAKVTRDMRMKMLSEEYGPVGSGYPADPITNQFLSRNWQEGHNFFRKSWATYKKLQDTVGQASLSDFGNKAEEHAGTIKKFDVLKEYGWDFVEPTNQYEVVRMKKGNNTIIRYTTGKQVVQGPDKPDVEKLLEQSGL